MEHESSATQAPQRKRARLFSVNIRAGQSYALHGKNGRVNMILFGGSMDAPFYRGTILDGGVDTQKDLPGCPFTLSARYMFEGTDADGNPARLFIENNGTLVDGQIVTRPMILTDSPALQWLEDVELEGRVAESATGGLVIEYYAPEEVVREHLGS